MTDPEEAFRHVFERPEGGITPLGGPRELGGHKGYGLAVMVHILGGTLSGASFSPIRNRTQGPSDPHNLGHFFLAIDPRGLLSELGLVEHLTPQRSNGFAAMVERIRADARAMMSACTAASAGGST